MEVNKEQAERCRDIGAEALRRGDLTRAIKMFKKSLQLYPLPGVEALLAQAEAQQRKSENENGDTSSGQGYSSNSAPPPQRSSSTASSTAEASTSAGADGRAYTEEQVRIVQQVLSAKEGGRGAHYRVLSLQENCSEAQIKKAYRKLSLKVHPDKNSAPHADEAFKAVGLAYATLSDPQKRTIYDRYGEEDPDNRGGGMRPGGGMHMRPGQEVSPEEIFNMFFGGGMAGMHAGGPGFHVYTQGFGGPGMQFGGRGGQGMQFGGRRARGRQQQRPPEDHAPGLGMLFQFLPIILIMLVSFFRFNETEAPRGSMPGEEKYFSLTHKPPFTNPLATRLTPVKDIPYFVSDRFLRTYYRDRFQLAQVERLVEKAYENYLVKECKTQQQYKKKLQTAAETEKEPQEQVRKLKQAEEFELSRCSELDDLFPRRKQKAGGRR